MNEHNLHRVLGLLADAAGLTQPQGFLHNYQGCMGQVLDYGSYWHCGSCQAQLHKRPTAGQPHGLYETNKHPSPQAMSFISQQLGPPDSAYYGSPPPVAYSAAPVVTPELIRTALGISPEEMDKLLDRVTRPEPSGAIEQLDQDLRRYTELV